MQHPRKRYNGHATVVVRPSEKPIDTLVVGFERRQNV